MLNGKLEEPLVVYQPSNVALCENENGEEENEIYTRVTFPRRSLLAVIGISGTLALPSPSAAPTTTS
jgi:hypothetical protein